MIKAALFPIPECVAFPNVDLPLHIFEPRYRQMVHYCIENQLRIAICHTQKLLHHISIDQTSEEALHTNQSTYKPCKVFSAGHCSVIETFDDGRMAINVVCDKRLKLNTEIQRLPFIIAHCDEYEDIPSTNETAKNAALTKQKIIIRLLAITHEFPEAREILCSNEWQQKTPAAFSFEVLQLLNIDASITQEILESRKPDERLHILLSLLNSNDDY